LQHLEFELNPTNKNDEPPVCIEAFCYELKYNNSVEFVSDEKLRISKLSLYEGIRNKISRFYFTEDNSVKPFVDMDVGAMPNVMTVPTHLSFGSYATFLRCMIKREAR
jgi:hypothetical protein